MADKLSQAQKVLQEALAAQDKTHRECLKAEKKAAEIVQKAREQRKGRSDGAARTNVS